SQFSLFEIMALIRSIRTLLLESSTLKPNDIYRSSEASAKSDPVISLDKSRAENLINGLLAILNGSFTNNVLNILNALPTEPTPAEQETIRQNVDQYLNNVFDEMEKLRKFGLPQTGSGHLYQRRAEIINALKQKMQVV